MRWEDERYVRLYTRNTPGWCVVSWQARAVLPLVMRSLDRAGVIELGEDGLEGLAVLVMLPVEIVVAGVGAWLERGTLEMHGSTLVMPKFMDAQDASASNAQRSREKRARAREIARESDRPVSPRVASDTDRVASATERVATDTPRRNQQRDRHDPTLLAVPSLAVPSRTEPNQDPPLPPDGGREERPSGSVMRTLPRSERALWSSNWISRYEIGVRRGLSRDWAFDKESMSTLEDLIGAFCKDKTNIESWIESVATEFAETTVEEDAKYWSGHQPKGLRRWLNEGRQNGRVDREASFVEISQGRRFKRFLRDGKVVRSEPLDEDVVAPSQAVLPEVG
jgi:hypothetical protein